MSKIVNDNGSFRITEGKGFQITFANGYTASVQFGSGNYCSNFADIMETRDNCESSTAEDRKSVV